MRFAVAVIAVLCVQCAARAAAAESPSPAQSGNASVYDLPVRLVDQQGHESGLDVARGHPTLVSMFYTSCPAACPMLISKIQAIESALPAQRRADLRVVLVSLDPERDTPKRRLEVVAEHHLDARWSLLGGDAATVRKVAAVLDFQYHQRSDGDFDHSSALLLLDGDGVVVERVDATRDTSALVDRLLHAPGGDG